MTAESISPATSPRGDIAAMLLDRVGDSHLGLRTRDRDWTWDDVVGESAARGALARKLRADGPFHIGVLLENVPDFIFWLGGAALTGATIVGINPTRGPAEMAAEIRHTDCQLIVTDTEHLGRLQGLELGLTADRFLVIDTPEYLTLIDENRTAAVASDGVGAESLLLLLFTSGTTGVSKAVKCSHGKVAIAGVTMTQRFDLGHDDVCYVSMPLFHSNAVLVGWAVAAACRGSLALRRKFSASNFLVDVRRFGATYANYVGKPLSYVLATPERPDDADNPLRAVYGNEGVPRDIERQQYMVRMRGAQEWRLCVDCDGTGRRDVAGKAIACSSCDNHGYVV